MNRRQFTQTALAAGLAPLAPSVSMARAAPAVKPVTYAWASMIARAQNGVSADYLMRQLGVSADVAGQLYSRLLTDGVIRMQSAAGVARAVKPLQIPGLSSGAGSNVASVSLKDVARKIDEVTDRLVEDPRDDETETLDTNDQIQD
jgi:hypothetical protein